MQLRTVVALLLVCGAVAEPCASDKLNHIGSLATDNSAYNENGIEIYGCNNTVADVTNGTAPMKVVIYGSDNVVSDDVVYLEDDSRAAISIGSADVASNDNVVTGNVANSIEVSNTNTPDGPGAGSFNNVVAGNHAGRENVATDSSAYIYVVSASGNTLVDNTVGQDLYVRRASDNVVTNNFVNGTGEVWAQLYLEDGQGNHVENNMAVRACGAALLYLPPPACCLTDGLTDGC